MTSDSLSNRSNANSVEPPPDHAEEAHAELLDNVVPTFGYHKIPMVGIGGSAGSINALRKFFHAMPDDSGLVFVVVMHLSPEHESTLAALLAQHTTMRVVQVRDTVKVETNCVYVIPPGKVLSAADGTLQLADLRQEKGRRVTVDLFFRTLADSYGPHTAAIVLSGADGDGAVGIKRIKERGGLTIAQDPDEAEYAGMPRESIATGMIDWVLPVSEMPARLLPYFQRERSIVLPPEDGPEPLGAAPVIQLDNENTLREVLSFVRSRTGRDFAYYKRATILRRIARRLQVNEIDNLTGYLAFLRTNPGESAALMQDLLISVTNFFRDSSVFAALEDMLPTMLANRATNEAFRVWVPACATGEEAYSIAMLLLEASRDLETPPSFQIFATDLDEDAIQTARDGLYQDAITADVPEDRLKRFFVKEPVGGYRVRREVREMVLFAHHDLLKDSPFSRLDLISCRNLLIYLNQEAKSRALDIFHIALRPEGRLLLGTSESVDEDSALFSVLDKKHRLYQQRPLRRTTMPVPFGISTMMRSLATHELNAERPVVASHAIFPSAQMSMRRALTDDRTTLWSDLHFKLIDRIASPSILVNANHDIMHVSEGAARYLQFSGGEPTQNLVTLIHPALRIKTRAALYSASHGNAETETAYVPIDIDGVSTSVNIRVIPAGDKGSEFMLVVFDAGTVPDNPRTPAAHDSELDAPARQLEREIDRMKVYMRDTVEQYEASEEELKASNEELQAMNEELHAATEELETSREELQSINEELITVNHELKGKVDELARANSDVHNLMAATAIAMIFLDRDLRITRFTPPAIQLFKLIASDVGRPLADLKHHLEYPELDADTSSVLHQLMPIEREVRGGGQHWFLARLRPYRTTEDQFSGVVLTFVDITESKRAQAALEQQREKLVEALADAEAARVAMEAASHAKDQFLAVLSHELRTPLTPVLLAVNALELHAVLSDKLKHFLEVIRRNVRLETRFIDDLLDVTRISRGLLEFSRERMDLHEALNSAIEITLPEINDKHQVLEVTMNAADHSINGDFNRIQQCFWNILKNAAKFTPERGHIRLSTESDGEFVTVTIADTGIGIDQDVIGRVFDPYSQGSEQITRQFGGLGLGLAISRGTVAAHDGVILADSAGSGSGATITVKLPIDPGPVQDA